jgi:hypothetical protein
MMLVMKRKWLNFVHARLASRGHAQPQRGLGGARRAEHDVVDARLEGYTTNVTIEGASTGLSWVLLVVLGAIMFAGLFKDAKRTHLD